MKHFPTFLTVCAAAALFLSFDNPKKAVRDYPKDFFQSPVPHSVSISGSFGELRPNHFHSGIDIRPASSGVTEPILAAGDGYVSRIKIAPSGYGNALYITHPNGYVTVYGHLDRYATAIQEYARKKQYEQESFEVDLTPAPNELPVSKGQQVAMMGNTGHSFGMHLHFEIRDAATEETVNPFLFGISPADHIAPSMQSLKIYLLNEKNEVTGSQFASVRKTSGNQYTIDGNLLSLNAAKVAFALKTFDRHDGDSGENGVFSIETQRDDQTIHRFVAERFSFSETRYINAHLDFQEQNSRKALLNRLWRLPGNQLSMYESEVNAGIVDLSATPARMHVTARDVAGNAATLDFQVASSGNGISLPPPSNYQYLLPVNEESIVKIEGATIYFPKNALYENLYLKLTATNNVGSSNTFSQTIHVHDVLTPVHAPFKIGLRADNLPPELQSKAFIGYCRRSDGNIYTIGGKFDAATGLWTGQSDKFGNFCVMTDQIAPRVQTLNLPEKINSENGRISFKINDNFEAMGAEASNLKFRATIDEDWILMEYEQKSDMIWHKFSGDIADGKHRFKLVVTDPCGNETVIEKEIELDDDVHATVKKASKPSKKSSKPTKKKKK
ncbi:MAG: hypothetical protein RL757_1980 [Bacteroidota bacterium]|jgi:murein DD-endopeptidase MepM/ murein hydrolase activator NlpD